MKIESYSPCDLLMPFIKNYLHLEYQDEQVNRCLPDTSVVIVFRYKGQVNFVTDHVVNKLPPIIFSGIRKTVRLINYSSDSGTIIVRFKESAAAAFFKQPLYELFEESISLADFETQQKVSIIEEQLSEAKNNIQRIAIVEQFLLSKLSDQKPDKLISRALEKIYFSKGIVKIKDLATSLYISQDAFEKRFRKTTGTSAKHFSSIVRMKSVINLAPESQPLIHVAMEAGYFDQPHFNREFKLFTGLAPTAFFKLQRQW